jgi:competence protein ComEA
MPLIIMRVRTFAKRIAALIRGSAWTSLLVRGVALVGALLVLAWVGRSAIASSGPVPTTTMLANDGGAAPVMLTSAIIPSPSAPPPLPIGPPATLATVASPPSARATSEDPVYVNHASAEQLRRLPGVGPKRAEAIVQLRQKMGRFQRVEDLLRVKGIGRMTLRKWRPLVRLDSPPLPPSPSALPDAG